MYQQPIPHLLALKGEALIALKRLEEAAEALEDAKLGAELRQAPSILWRIQRAIWGRSDHLPQARRSRRSMSGGRPGEILSHRNLPERFDRSLYRANISSRRRWQSLPSRKASIRHVGQRLKSVTGALAEREIEVSASRGTGADRCSGGRHRLVTGPRTVHSHLNAIYSKLGITSRSAATRYAFEHRSGFHPLTVPCTS